MAILELILAAVFFIGIGRLSTSFWRTDEQNFREESIDYWARQRAKPCQDVSYDWRKNQRQTRCSADAKAGLKNEKSPV